MHNSISSAGTLVISFIGLQTQEVEIQPVVKVVLHADSEVLDEVMVVAYGTAKKSSFTGSASVVGGDKIESRPITNVSKALEGQTTGILTTSGSGQPGESASIVIRGYGSINASQDPLYVVDGVPYDGTLSSINPSDIESMTILKDASAGALYGARGANGVVMITTKQGKEGKTNVTWRSTAGWSSRAIPEYETVSQKDFVQLSYEAARNSYAFGNGYSWEQAEALARASLARNLGGSAGELYNPFKNYTWDQLIDPATGQVRSDVVAAWNEPWLDAVQQNGAFRHEHQLSLSGGSAKTKYMFSLGYVNEDGILTNTGFQRYNGRANITSDVTDWFKANMNVSLTHSIMNYSQYDGSSQSNVWYSAQFISPLLPVYIKDEAGNNLLDSNGNPQLDYGESGRPGSYDDYNPLGGLVDDKSWVKNDVASLRTGFTLGGDKDEFGVFKGLKFSVNFGMDYRNQNQMDYMNMYHGNQANAGGLLQKYSVRMQSYTFNQLLTWNRTFGLHNFDVMAGHEFYAYQYEYLSAGRTGLVDGILELRPGAVLYDADSYTNKYRIESWFGRLNYNFDEKYYFSASLRTDGSSRFYKDNRWGTFWSVGGNWRVSKEEFMKDLTWINNLSVKLSYGQQGNDNILDANGNSNYYLWQGLYDLSWTNENNPGAMPSSLENRSLTWEKNGNLNVGFEALLLDHRLSINAEYYNKKTTDMLLSYPMATSTGYNGYNANVGSMRNSGFEFEIRGTLIKTEDLTWNLSFMGSTVNNKVLELTGNSPEIINGIYSIKEGMPINTFYMAKSAGVDPATGAQLYWAYDKDANGNITNEYITSDYSKANNSKYYLGSRIPDLYGSISTDLTWKGIDLSILTTYSIGGKIYDSLYAGSMNNMYYNNTWNVHALRRWQKPGDITDVPRIEIAGSYANNDRFLVDASYFAIKNITLGYTLPKVWMQKARLGSVRVFASVDNLALFTHLQGMDPQYNFSGSTDYAYTPNKTWSLGFEVNF